VPLYSVWPAPRPFPQPHSRQYPGHIDISRSLVHTVSLTHTHPTTIIQSFSLSLPLTHTHTHTHPSPIISFVCLRVGVSCTVYTISLLYYITIHTTHTAHGWASAAEEQNSCVDWSVTRNIIHGPLPIWSVRWR